MYIAVCDDQIEELEKLTALLQAWQSDRRSDVRFQTFRSGGQLLDAAQSPFGVALTREQCIQYALDRPAVLTVMQGAANVEELKRKPLFAQLLKLKVFERAVTITRHGAERRYQVAML